jgi:hypothetical protein
MKNIVVGFGFLIIIITQSCTTLPMVFDENIGRPITLSIISPPDSININGTDILINYTWNGNKSKFENSQNADGEIKYTFSAGKSASGINQYDWSSEYPFKESEEVIGYVASSLTNDTGEYVIGNGSLMFRVSCSYKDKDGNKHWGYVSNYLEIPVIFTYLLIN